MIPKSLCKELTLNVSEPYMYKFEEKVYSKLDLFFQ